MGKRGVKDILKRKGLLVRDCTSFHLPKAIRFSIRKKFENDFLLNELKNFDINPVRGINYEI